MTRLDGSSLSLQVKIGFARVGSVTWLLLLLFVVGVGAFVALDSQAPTSVDALRQTRAERLARFRAPAAGAPATPAAQQHLAAFYAVLGEPSATEAHVKLLFDVARRSGISLAQGEYKWSVDGSGQTERYQIRLPVKGSYAAIRAFCEAVLRELPFASLDELSLKRQVVADATLDATVQFSLHLHAGAATAAAAAAAVRGHP